MNIHEFGNAPEMKFAVSPEELKETINQVLTSLVSSVEYRGLNLDSEAARDLISSRVIEMVFDSEPPVV